jgi:hypothetical protein
LVLLKNLDFKDWEYSSLVQHLLIVGKTLYLIPSMQKNKTAKPKKKKKKSKHLNFGQSLLQTSVTMTNHPDFLGTE